MQTHMNLEKLLVDFLCTLDKDCVLIERIDIAKTVRHYLSTNSLNQAEPEPLTNNKQAQEFTSNCCNKPIYYEDFDENPYCTECLGGCEVNE